jgi:lipase (class 3)
VFWKEAKSKGSARSRRYGFVLTPQLPFGTLVINGELPDVAVGTTMKPSHALLSHPKSLSQDDLSRAESLTILIHGVGDSSSEALLAASTKGLIASGLGDTCQRAILPECPTLSRERGAEAMLIQGSKGKHFVIALPWADRRVRLSFIAQCCLVLLFVITAIATVAFLICGPLDSAAYWLRSWRHLLLAYLLLVVGSFFLYLFSTDPKAKYKSPSLGIFLWPIALLFVLELFATFAPLLWILVGILILLLWTFAVRIIARCVPLAQTSSWRFALIMLTVALTVCSASAVRTIWHFTDKIVLEQAHAPRHMPVPSSRQAFERFMDDDDLKQGEDMTAPEGVTNPSKLPQPAQGTGIKKGPGRSTVAKPSHSSVPAAGENANDLSSTRSTRRNSDEEITFPQAPLAFRPSVIKSPTTAIENLVKSHIITLCDLISAFDFKICLFFTAICLLGCVFAFSFNWLLDFGLDVLNYGGNAKTRAFLLVQARETISWLRSQAPGVPLVVVGHSLGSVIASHAVSSVLSDMETPSGITLVTLGSPLNYLYRVFPTVVKGPHQLSEEITPRARWLNFWRAADPIGKALDTEPGKSVQYCVGNGTHPDYWSDGCVWNAVAYESFRLGEKPRISGCSGDSGRCLLETRLGLLVVGAIVLLGAFGTLLWIHF